jgi:hypothetical protein
MSDDWRVEWDLDSDGVFERLRDQLREHEVADEARGRLGERVIVTSDPGKLFAYASTAEEAAEAARVLGELLVEHGLTGGPQICRWHPEEERWEAPDVPLPSTPAEHEAERARLRETERAESRAAGADEWEVRVALGSHADTVALADRLEAEGTPVVRRSRFLIVGAPSEDDARALAERIRAEAPAGAEIEAEGSEALVWAREHRPFAVFGGLGL